MTTSSTLSAAECIALTMSSVWVGTMLETQSPCLALVNEAGGMFVLPFTAEQAREVGAALIEVAGKEGLA